ncbi:MAG: hypothetical protein COX82_03605 [Candidatus Magasanikbacteria bacterium CG_4_10_14_0_2_um_filter_41_10]|uniref:Uncharacterized protein n=1 Tax=Candidatus Magasanikbacteria bacterium CG_4_10_14_0_2_um_filter_41_10 TaxID=1974638 RepID=A0A2M7V3G0_9BACT|nr:MAG: hypothetical protein COX82_03605 [Candidatus Magasanikbacteria bacterium CG_4_10_14_0_2_um_filter_41_10]
MKNIFLYLDIAIQDTVLFIKNNLLAVIVSALFLFGVIWMGSVISVVTSRDILDPLTVQIDGIGDDSLSSVKVLSILSRAGNTVYLASLPGHANEWYNPGKTFISKILVGFKTEHLEQHFMVTVSLGDTHFTYTKEQFLDQWKKVDAKNDASFLYSSEGSSEYVLYEAPGNVQSHPLHVSFAPHIFSSINFNASEKLIQKPLFQSIKIFFLTEIMVLLIFVLLNTYRKINHIAFDKRETLVYRRRYLLFVLSVVSTFVLIGIFDILVRIFYKPDTLHVFMDASKIYLNSTLPAFLPKPVERVQFMYSIMFSPFLLLFSFGFWKRYIVHATKEKIERLYQFLMIALPHIVFAIVYIGLAVSNFLYVSTSFSFHGIGKYLYALLLFPLGVYGMLFMKKKYSTRYISYALYIFYGICLSSILLINVFPYNIFTELNDAFHLDPVFYPMSQVMMGKTMLVNLGGLYGLYPVFLQPIFQLAGLSVLSFTSVMAFLLVLSYVVMFLFLKREVKHPFIVCIGFATILFYYLENGNNAISYFQYWPIRILFPSLALLLISVYVKHKKRVWYYLIFAMSGLSILWNLDSGIIIFLSWMITLVYSEFLTIQKNRSSVLRIFRHIVVGCLTVGLTFLMYSVYAYLRSGSFADMTMLWQYQKLFFAGYFMIPMPFPHVWIVAALIFLVGLLLAVKGWLNKEERSNPDMRAKNIVIFFLTVMGLGLFTYYEGRSHDLTFYGPMFTVILLLTLFADILYQNYVTHTERYGYGIFFLFIFFFLFSSPINLIANSGKYYSWVTTRASTLLQGSQTMMTRNVDFIQSHTTRGEHIIIFSKKFYDGIFYGESRTRSSMDISASTDIFFKSEVEYLMHFLKCNTNDKVFVYPSSDYAYYDDYVDDILRNEYSVVDKSTDDMVFLMKNVSSTVSEGCID